MKNKSISTKVIKVLGIFTGAEAVNMVCSIIKMKIVSLWLHAAGVGIFGIFNTTIDTIYILSGLGLRQSTVKDVAEAAASGERSRLLAIVSAVRTWGWISGCLGAVIMSALAFPLSVIFFNTPSLWWQFMIAAAALLFNSLLFSEQALLQATSHFKSIARVSVTTSILNLIIAIPLYRYLGNVGIPISISTAWIISFVAIRRVRLPELREARPARTAIRTGTNFVRMGSAIAVASFIANLLQMAFLAWLTRKDSETMVGYYQAGNTIVIRYVSIIFSAIMLEFYPRMTVAASSRMKSSVFLAHEISLLLAILTPMLFGFLIFRSIVVQLLYTSDFLVIIPFITVAILNIIFRAVSNAMGVCVLAKGDAKTYIITESADAVIGFLLSVTLFNMYGLTGVGIAIVLWYLIYTFMVASICRFRYKYRLPQKTIFNILFTAFVATGAVILRFVTESFIVDIILGAGILCYIPVIRAFFVRKRRVSAVS